MRTEVLYYTAEGVAVYKGEEPPTNKELHRDPESYSVKELANMSHNKRRQLNREYNND